MEGNSKDQMQISEIGSLEQEKTLKTVALKNIKKIDRFLSRLIKGKLEKIPVTSMKEEISHHVSETLKGK